MTQLPEPTSDSIKQMEALRYHIQSTLQPVQKGISYSQIF